MLNDMRKCEICGVSLRLGYFYERFLSFFRIKEYRNPKPLMVLDIPTHTIGIILVCDQDREWIRNNPDAAEAILVGKLLK